MFLAPGASQSLSQTLGSAFAGERSSVNWAWPSSSNAAIYRNRWWALWPWGVVRQPPVWVTSPQADRRAPEATTCAGRMTRPRVPLDRAVSLEVKTVKQFSMKHKPRQFTGQRRVGTLGEDPGSAFHLPLLLGTLRGKL